MRLLETIEDGSKAQIVWEGLGREDVEAIHAYQTAQGRGTLIIAEDGIQYVPGPRRAPAGKPLNNPY